MNRSDGITIYFVLRQKLNNVVRKHHFRVNINQLENDKKY